MKTTVIGMLAAACASVLLACSTPKPEAAAELKTVKVNGYDLPYAEQGRGVPIVFVHGAVSDYRAWNGPRAVLGQQYRAISYTQRYFGTAPWGGNWPPLGEQTHAEDLTAFIQALGAGPVHLVARSYGSHIVLAVALNHPELVRSALVWEPAAPTYVTDAGDLQRLREDGAAFGPAAAAAQAGNNDEAVRQLIDTVSGRSGYFDTQPEAGRRMQLDSARTMPMMMKPKITPAISCAQLGSIQRPVAVLRGDASRTLFRVIGDTAARCIPGGPHRVVPGAAHLWPAENPAAFSQLVAAFIAGQS